MSREKLTKLRKHSITSVISPQILPKTEKVKTLSYNKCALEQVQAADEQFGCRETKHLLYDRVFTFSSPPLDIVVPLRYIKCINSINTLLTYLVQCMLRFPEVFEDSAALAAE